MIYDTAAAVLELENEYFKLATTRCGKDSGDMSSQQDFYRYHLVLG